MAPLAKTCTGPVGVPYPTVATIWVSLQLTTVSVDPLMLTLPEPWLAWKPEPVMVTCVPTPPLVGEMLVTRGAGTA